MIKIIKKFLPYSLKKIFKNLMRLFFLPNLKLIKKLNLKYVNNNKIAFLGSDYGGWYYIDDNELFNSQIISAGLGEDASFDIELINKYNCKVISVDPTPKAIEHYYSIINNSGKKKELKYNNTGREKVESYDLKNISKENYILENNALFDQENQIVDFYKPINSDDVSHSIGNWQNDYKTDTPKIQVKTTKVKNILTKHNIAKLALLKLDIEGAEIEVINDIIHNKIYPNQILVEMDELHNLNTKSFQRFKNIYDLLILNGYSLIKTKGKFQDMLFLRNFIKL